MKTLNESLNHLDMENHVLPLLTIDEFKSRVGEDDDVITLNFIVDNKDVADDLVMWLERGYDFILDAETSPGEVENGKYYVFAEINRRPSAPRKIMEILNDLNTLTGIDGEDWEIRIDHDRYPASKETIERYIPLTAAKYREREHSDLNEWRQVAGIRTVNTYEADEEITAIQRQAGIR